MTHSTSAYLTPPNGPIAGTILDAAYMIGRSRNYLYELQKRGLLKIHTDSRRPKVRTVIYSELLDAVRKAAEAESEDDSRTVETRNMKRDLPLRRSPQRRRSRATP